MENANPSYLSVFVFSEKSLISDFCIYFWYENKQIINSIVVMAIVWYSRLGIIIGFPELVCSLNSAEIEIMPRDEPYIRREVNNQVQVYAVSQPILFLYLCYLSEFTLT